MRGIVPAERVEERRAALREISAEFSGSRDEAVLKNLCGTLSEGRSSEQERALQSIGREIRFPESEEHISPSDLASLLHREKKEWLRIDWSEEAHCREVLGERLVKSYRKARKATKRARKTIFSEEWHDWRKAIKQFRYQCEFVAELENRPPTDFEQQVHDLGSLLGQRNDLANLEKHVDSDHAGEKKGRDSIGTVIDESTRQVIKKCRKMGKKLFHSKQQDPSLGFSFSKS